MLPPYILKLTRKIYVSRQIKNAIAETTTFIPVFNYTYMSLVTGTVANLHLKTNAET